MISYRVYHLPSIFLSRILQALEEDKPPGLRVASTVFLEQKNQKRQKRVAFVLLRCTIEVVVMSATIHAAPFVNFFGGSKEAKGHGP